MHVRARARVCVGTGACALVGMAPAPALIGRFGALATLAMANVLVVAGMSCIAAAAVLVSQAGPAHQPPQEEEVVREIIPNGSPAHPYSPTFMCVRVRVCVCACACVCVCVWRRRRARACC